jgi:hypothetical protein
VSAFPLPSAGLRARVLAEARGVPVPPRTVGARRGVGVLAAGFAVTLAVGVRLGAHPGARPLAYIVGVTCAWLAVAGAATWAGVARGQSMLGRTEGWRAAAVSATPLALLALWWALAMVWPQTMENDAGWFEVTQCLVGTGLLGVGPLLAFLYLRRASEPVNPWLGGAALGVAAGSWGAAALIVICRHASPSHMLLGHVAPVLLLAALGAWLGGRVLAVRARRS